MQRRPLKYYITHIKLTFFKEKTKTKEIKLVAFIPNQYPYTSLYPLLSCKTSSKAPQKHRWLFMSCLKQHFTMIPGVFRTADNRWLCKVDRNYIPRWICLCLWSLVSISSHLTRSVLYWMSINRRLSHRVSENSILM